MRVFRQFTSVVVAAILASSAWGQGTGTGMKSTKSAPSAKARRSAKSSGALTVAEAEKFIRQAEQTLLQAGIKQQRASWVQSTYITDDTEILAAQANDDAIALTTQLVNEAKRFENLKLPPDTARKSTYSSFP